MKYFKDNGDKITQVSCGHAHSIAKSSASRIYSWGMNFNGQLGVGGEKDSNFPKVVRIPEYKNNVVKVRCVQAGYHNSYVLCEDKKVFFSGVNSNNCENQTTFMRLDYEQRTFKGKLDVDYSPVKLFTKWSNSIQLTYMVFADFRGCQTSKLIREKQLANMLKNWEDSYNQTMPPFDDKLTKSFSQKYMKKKWLRGTNFKCFNEKNKPNEPFKI